MRALYKDDMNGRKKQNGRRGILVGAALCLLLMVGCGSRHDGGAAAPEEAAPPDTTASSSAPEPGTLPDTAATAWTAGIVDVSSPKGEAAVLTAVRAGRHGAFDRVVFVFEERLPGYHVEYVDRPVRACGSGRPVPLAGDGWLEVRLFPARAYTEGGESTVEDGERSPGLLVLKELKMTCSGFEADVTWVLGLAAPNRYRVQTLQTPPRLIVDVRHC